MSSREVAVGSRCLAFFLDSGLSLTLPLPLLLLRLLVERDDVLGRLGRPLVSSTTRGGRGVLGE